MTKRDVERFLRQRTGITTGAERDARIDQIVRFRRDETGDTEIRPVGMNLPPGFSKGDGTKTFTPASSTGYARYIGRAVPRLQSVQFLWRVTTAGAAPVYAEWGLAVSEEPVMTDSLTLNYLTTIGWTDVAGSLGSTFRKMTTISDFGQVNAGVRLWLIFAQQGSTGLVLRGGGAQEGGFLLSKAGAAQPSTMAIGAQFDEVATSLEDIWLVVKQVQA